MAGKEGIQRDIIDVATRHEGLSRQPELVSQQEFGNALVTASGREELLSMMQQQIGTIESLRKQKNLLVKDMSALEKQQEIEGWENYKKTLSTFKKWVEGLKGDGIPLSEEVKSARFDQWAKFFDVSARVLRTLREYKGTVERAGGASASSTETAVVQEQQKDHQTETEPFDTSAFRQEVHDEIDAVRGRLANAFDPDNTRQDLTREEVTEAIGGEIGNEIGRTITEIWNSVGGEGHEMTQDEAEQVRSKLADLKELTNKAVQKIESRNTAELQATDDTDGDRVPTGLYPNQDRIDAMQEEMDNAVEGSGDVGVPDEEEPGGETPPSLYPDADQLNRIQKEMDEAVKESGDIQVPEDQEPEKDKDIPGPSPKAEKMPTPERQEAENPEYKRTRDDWRAARKTSEELAKEFSEKYRTHLEGLEKKGWLTPTKIGHVARKIWGLQPKMSPELEQIEQDFLAARKRYAERSNDLMGFGEEHQIHQTGPRSAYEQMRDKKMEAYKKEWIEKRNARYQRLMARKLVMHPAQERLRIQEEIFAEASRNGKFRKVQEVMRKSKYYRIGAMAVGYGTLAGVTAATGGASALYAGATTAGAYLGRVAVSMGIGAGVGLGTHKGLSETYVKAAAERLSTTKAKYQNESAYTSSFFDKDFEAEEREFENNQNQLYARTQRTKTISAAAAVAAGAGIGSSGLFNGGHAPEGPGGQVTEPPAQGPGPIEEPSHEVPPPYEPSQTEPPAGKPFPPPYAPESPEVSEPPTQGAATNINPIERNIETPPESSIEGKPFPPPYAPEQGNIDASPAESSVSDSTASSEVGPAASAYVPYEVQASDTKGLWNIMEGHGPDAHPTGGQSEVVRDMTRAERKHALDALIKYMDKNPEFTKSVGITSGNPDLIHPGEHINIGLLDDKIHELLTADPHGSADADISVPEHLPTPPAYEPGQTEAPTPPAYEPGGSVISQASEGKPFPPPYAPEHVANAPTENPINQAAITETVGKYVNAVEKPAGFLASIFGAENIQGTFDALKDATLNTIVDMQQHAPELQQFLQEHGISQEGFSKHFENIQHMDDRLPADPNETYGEYMARFAAAEAANDNVGRAAAA